MARPSSAPAPATRYATSFVGREALLSRVSAALAQHRFVTLLGPPGIGKSRLATELVRRNDKRCGWCEVENARSTPELLARLADTTGALLLGDMDRAWEVLGAALRSRFDWLVLDGAELAQATLGPVLMGLLEAAPALSILLTSRARIGVSGEAVLEVPPLDVAPNGEAEQLFADRASLVRHGFDAGGENAAPLQALVRVLDGHPLALEFAAARSRFMSLPELVGRMTDASARGTELPLAATIERSLEELPADVRSLFGQLSVFRGGFTLVAAEAVVEGPTAVLEALSALVDRSLVGTQAASGSPRFTLLQAVRAVGERDVAESERYSTRRRHRSFFAALARRCSAERDPVAIRRDLGRERDNLAAALEFAQAERAPELLVLATAWAMLHRETGPLSPQLESLETALRASDRADPDARANAAEVLAGIARDLDRSAEVVALIEELVREATEQQQRAASAILDAALGETHTVLGRFDEGARSLLRARQLERELRRPAREARALHSLAVNRLEQGQLGEARLLLREASALLDERDISQRARTLAVLAVIELEEGRLAEAKQWLDQALSMARSIDDRRLLPLITTNLAVAAHELGQLGEAIDTYGEAAQLCRSSGMRRGEAIAQAFIGHCHLERGDFQAARAAYEEALGRLAKEGWRYAMVLAPFAAAVAMDGDLELAGRALDEAERSLAGIGQNRLMLAVDVWRGFVDLAEANAFTASGDATRARICVEAALRRTKETLVDPAPRGSAGGGPALAQQSTDLRVALRALRRALAEQEPRAEQTPSWLISADGSRLMLPSGARRDLSRRAALRRLVARLAKERITNAGAELTVEDLVSAGWPGEETGSKAGRDRVYAAVATLRKLGLDGLLQSTGDGYRFDPTVPLRMGNLPP